MSTVVELEKDDQIGDFENGSKNGRLKNHPFQTAEIRFAGIRIRQTLETANRKDPKRDLLIPFP